MTTSPTSGPRPTGLLATGLRPTRLRPTGLLATGLRPTRLRPADPRTSNPRPADPRTTVTVPAPLAAWRERRRRAGAVRRGLAAVGAHPLAPLRGAGLPKDFSLVPVCPTLLGSHR